MREIGMVVNLMEDLSTVKFRQEEFLQASEVALAKQIKELDVRQIANILSAYQSLAYNCRRFGSRLIERHDLFKQQLDLPAQIQLSFWYKILKYFEHNKQDFLTSYSSKKYLKNYEKFNSLQNFAQKIVNKFYENQFNNVENFIEVIWISSKFQLQPNISSLISWGDQFQIIIIIYQQNKLVNQFSGILNQGFITSAIFRFSQLIQIKIRQQLIIIVKYQQFSIYLKLLERYLRFSANEFCRQIIIIFNKKKYQFKQFK
eukprot:TRINITY_DN6104_c0_g1_i12.p1 TRINITY_DN6104_c0_g1~~TRINITY_DN6104_c0_g1_i12.p1  ORF type:complete len:259 (-),score=13.02 TRINITY_DN6104_c0_g1_i12:320-1096(-)